ncbi:hypothetical protein VB776_20440 [Arcicella sp. DC2W]|uniref:Uncharacterized protein n=1 Tax=Arcicella gelida TaxID=2984195 RepID=A0ABU5SAT3_9BACT|nr:hypothetical protein [Arcicella sp. DC2W]MEA5405318.1 hypothetical protein [Arcicella sp. DC2W]
MKIQVYIIFLLTSINAFSQIKLDSIPNASNARIVDTLFMDINNDKLEDVLLVLKYKSYKNNPVPAGEVARSLALYVNKGNNYYQFQAINKKLLSLTYNLIKSIDNNTFLVINEPTKQDWNRYYSYFTYAEENHEWLLSKQEVYRAYYEKGEDFERKKLVRQILYPTKERIPFSEASFEKLFGDLRNVVYKEVLYAHVQVPKAYIYQSRDVKTKKYLVKGDAARVVNEEGKYVQIIFYPDPKITKINKIEGWLRKEDIVGFPLIL